MYHRSCGLCIITYLYVFVFRPSFISYFRERKDIEEVSACGVHRAHDNDANLKKNRHVLSNVGTTNVPTSDHLQ